MSSYNRNALGFYAGVTATPKSLPVVVPDAQPRGDGGRLTACTVALGDGVGLDWGEIIQVTATGELCLAPDYCRLVVSVSGSKQRVLDVKNSVTRRLDYVLQTLRNYQIKDVEVVQNLQRVGGLFLLTADVVARLDDLGKVALISNLLAEKLDEHVVIAPPRLLHSANKLEHARTQVSLQAVNNCKHKASDLAAALGARLGRVLAVREESLSQTDTSSADALPPDSNQPMSMQQRIQHATLSFSATVNVTFQLNVRNKNKKK